MLPPNNLPPEVIKRLITDLDLKTLAAEKYLELALRHAKLFDNKQQDYGPQNISKFGTYGVVVRMTDKFERIANLFNKGKRKKAINESIRDTFSDVHIYALIALLIESNQWPNV